MLRLKDLARETGARWNGLLTQAQKINRTTSRLVQDEDGEYWVSKNFADFVREQQGKGDTGQA